MKENDVHQIFITYSILVERMGYSEHQIGFDFPYYRSEMKILKIMFIILYLLLFYCYRNVELINYSTFLKKNQTIFSVYYVGSS